MKLKTKRPERITVRTRRQMGLSRDELVAGTASDPMLVVVELDPSTDISLLPSDSLPAASPSDTALR